MPSLEEDLTIACEQQRQMGRLYVKMRLAAALHYNEAIICPLYIVGQTREIRA